MKRFAMPSADFFYPQIFKKFRAKAMETPEFVPIAEAPASKRLVELSFPQDETEGQVLRTALALSCITNKPFHLTQFQGLNNQALRNILIAMGEISNARIFGFAPNSQEVRFHPKPSASGLEEQTRSIKHIELGSTQSVTSALHCLVPVLWHTPGKMNSLFVVGGTNLIGEQCLDAYCESVLPLFHLEDFSIERDAPSPPALGSFQIRVSEEWKRTRRDAAAVNLLKRGKLVGVEHVVAHGDREALAESVVTMLRAATLHEEKVSMVEVTEEFKAQASGPCIVSRLEFENYVQVFSRHYRVGETLEGFVNQVSKERHAYLGHTAPVQAEFAHLLLLPILCTEQGGAFRTNALMRAFHDECKVIQAFVKLRGGSSSGKEVIEWKEEEDGTFTVNVAAVKLAPVKA